ncbi:MAG: LacI family DNA-binding transcriptional regulator [Phycisphaerales bacterium]|nr:LacI family DNA-binding transcriptional regulator [Phycisphaerales bacterium]
MTVSISDVAKLANVSISTVSRVINRPSLVNAQTRERVQSAINELGYHPNAFARGLMLRKSEMIGLVLPDMHGEFYSEIIRGANLKARDLGYNLIISSAHDPDDMHSLLDGVRQRRIMDGVAVMVAEVTDHIQKSLGELHLPFVVIDSDIDGVAHDSVTIDQREGARAMMRHLLDECGAKRIVFVGGLETNVDTMARLDAYRVILAERGITPTDDDVHHLDYQYETAYAFGKEHLRNWVGAGNCVFAANDEMASGIIDAAYALDIKVPKEIAVVGFDDTRIARMTRPPLTTVRVPMALMGATAIELLCKRLADPEIAEQRVSLRPQLITRRSCGGGGGSGSDRA